jgi:hypothetical protein
LNPAGGDLKDPPKHFLQTRKSASPQSSASEKKEFRAGTNFAAAVVLKNRAVPFFG